MGLEPRALALKARPLMKKINMMTLQKSPMEDRRLQRVTEVVSDIGQRFRTGCVDFERYGTLPTSWLEFRPRPRNSRLLCAYLQPGEGFPLFHTSSLFRLHLAESVSNLPTNP